MTELENCNLNTFDYSVTLPQSDRSPSDEFFYRVLFTCNGITYDSGIVNSVDAAFWWAENYLSDFGEWTLTDNVLSVTGTLCETGALAFAYAEETFVEGCTDFNSSNFNYLAVVDDGSCVGAITPHGGCRNPDATNYDPTATFDDDSCTFNTNQMVFNTASQKAVETKIGANIFESDVSHFTEWIPKTTQLGIQTLYYTPVSSAMNNSHAASLNTLATAAGTNIAIYVPIISFPFPAFYDWMVSKFNPVVIQLDQESELTGKDSDWIASFTPAELNTYNTNGHDINPIYIARAQQVIARYPTIKCSWDSAPIYSAASAKVNRNLALAPLTNTDYGRQYEQLSPDRMVFSATDNNYNLSLLNNYYSTLLPADLVQYFALLTHVTKQCVIQWHNADTGTQDLSNALRNFSIGEMARVTLANTEKFAYLFWMQLSELVRGTHPEFDSIKRVAKAFKYAFTMPVTIPLNGCSAQGFYNGTNGYGLLITNQTSTQQTIFPSDIVIAGKTVSGNFTRDSGYATDWSATVQNEIVTEASITVRKNSVNWITFNAM